MKIKRNVVVGTVLLCLLIITVAVSQREYVSASGNVNLVVRPTKKVFRLGEIVPVEVAITNSSNSALYVSDVPCIKISREDGQFKLYSPRENDFVLDGTRQPTIIKPHETLRIQRTILWNHKPEAAHLNTEAAEPLIEGRILTDYAFAEPGNYFVKGCIGISEKGVWNTVESEPVGISLVTPVGEDLAIWNRIKSKGDVGYFLQQGDVRMLPYKTEEREKLIAEIKQIVDQYPNSFYAESLRQSLAKFDENEKKREESRKKLAQAPNQ